MPSCRLDAPAGCRITSRCPHVSPPSCQLISPACCRIASPCPLVASHVALSFSRRAGWLLRRLSRRRPLVVSLSRCLVVSSPRRLVVSSYHRLIVSPSRRAASRCLVAPAGCRTITIISCHPQVAPPSRPLIVLAGCCIACPCATLSSSCRSPSLTPSNAIERCCLHRTPLPPPPLPQLPSNAIVKRQCPPSLSIAAVKR